MQQTAEFITKTDGFSNFCYLLFGWSSDFSWISMVNDWEFSVCSKKDFSWTVLICLCVSGKLESWISLIRSGDWNKWSKLWGRKRGTNRAADSRLITLYTSYLLPGFQWSLSLDYFRITTFLVCKVSPSEGWRVIKAILTHIETRRHSSHPPYRSCSG